MRSCLPPRFAAKGHRPPRRQPGPVCLSCRRTFRQPQECHARVGSQRPATHTPGAGVCRGFWRFSLPSVLQGSVPHQPCLEQGVGGEGCPAGPGAGDGPQAAPPHPTAGPWRAPGTSNKVWAAAPDVSFSALTHGSCTHSHSLVLGVGLPDGRGPPRPPAYTGWQGSPGGGLQAAAERGPESC